MCYDVVHMDTSSPYFSKVLPEQDINQRIAATEDIWQRYDM